MSDNQLVDLFQKARKDSGLTIVEGVQALKHSMRFKAEIQEVVTSDKTELEGLLNELALDVKQTILEKVVEVKENTFAKLSKNPHRTKVMAIAQRKKWQFDEIDSKKPIIFLEDPKDLENVGAVIRVSAAADAGAVIISGSIDIWHPAVIRGGAGLHWAIPVFSLQQRHSERSVESLAQILLRRLADQDDIKRKIISLDPNGEDINKTKIPYNALLIFGTERHGISPEILNQSDRIVRLPMKKGVSSLNLATSVAATLYQLST